MPAFAIVDTKIENSEEYEGYKALARPIAEKFGGKYLVRGGDIKVVEADLWQPTRMVVMEFPDMASAEAFYNSEEYAPVRKIRHDNSKCSFVIVEGV